ncbi:hypothetical protein M3Y94_00655700 [Aphelenchoides besseyi]|nr:hypothetical protein M3Y94_00655700 [Aphelenchoides besseyi]KAI6231181.1 hypothetical protein M3Y95_00354300 [Aphelenchoides besseyi]
MRFWFAVFLVLMFVGTAMAGHRRGFEGEKDPTERSNQLLDRKRAIYRSYSKNFNRLQKLRPEMFGEEYYKKKYDEPPPFLPDFVPLKDQSKEAYEKGPRESSSVLSQFKESDFNGPQALMLVDILEAELLKLKHQLKKQTRQSRKSIKKPKRKKIPAAENVYGDV